ncbi:DDRGK domain-containing protein 1 isoform X1 [Neophocaena asiaeorientalis asiaeorientalis]|uniref:DDRGK domain-containing protein 1 n=1 Tax=Neophocaena asiaeorientalis asiaeorientalis TaxID=1706337 RepID=A0A341BAS7_NEOAA|nr:DDRGK domain-containing protein 1 isoform X1 [Neophocaena asiaeorientalis asiaeorientalis]
MGNGRGHMGVRQGLSDPGPQAGRAGWFHLEAVVMVAPVVYLVAAALLVGLILFLTRSRSRMVAAVQEPLHNEEEAVVAGRVAQPQPLEPEEQRTGGRPRRRRDLDSRLQAQRRAQRVAWAEVVENDGEAVIPAQEEEDIEKPVETHLLGKIGAKKLRKLEEKQARKAQREAEEAEREERKRLESQREAEWKKEEERLRLEEEQKEEEERKAREEQAQREHEEYLKLKEAFVVEEEGVGETMTEEQSHSFLAEFINYIKQSKVVLLEDLASQVGLRTQDTINRIQDLLTEGTLTGVIDDRGKFIYITPEELAAMANFIRQRGRVSITELAQASNSLIAWGREPPAQVPA